MPDLEHPGALPESEQRHRMFEAVCAAVFAVRGPLLLVVDDLQHGDRETCQLLHYLLRIRPSSRLLVVAMARREELDGDHPLQGLLVGLRARERLSELELGPLSRAETTELAEVLTGAALGGQDAQRLYR